MVVLKNVEPDDLDSALRNNDSRELNFAYKLRQRSSAALIEETSKFTVYNYKKRTLYG